jgi:hypothetical protein
MATKKNRKSSKKAVDTKMAAANDTTIEIPKPEPVTAEQIAMGTAPSARTAAIMRSRLGKFNKQNLTVIGGAECPRFYPMTWAERDRFMAQDTEAAKIVKERYQKHMANIKP